MKQLRNLIEKIEHNPMNLWQIIGVFAASIYLRTFFENFTNSNNQGFLNSLTDTFLHYPLYYAAVFLAIILIVRVATRTPVMHVARVVAVFSFVLLTAPLFDLIAYGANGHMYNFVTGTWVELGNHFVTFLYSTDAVGIGLKIEVWLAIAGIITYVALKTKNVWRTIGAGLLTYVAIFFFLSLPMYTLGAYNLVSKTPMQPVDNTTIGQFYFVEEPALSSRPAPTGGMSPQFPGNQAAFNQFSISIATVLLVFSLFFLLILARLRDKTKFRALIKNFRWTRITHYVFITAAGLYIGSFVNQGFLSVGSLSDVMGIVALLIAVSSTWVFAVWENDEQDIVIDQISNTERPLVRNTFTKKEWAATKWLLLAIALIAGWLAGMYAFTFITLMLLVFHIYSVPPLRLKRVPVLSSVLISLAITFAFTAGVFMTLGSENFFDLPYQYIAGIFVIFLLGENVKNVKDIAGDRAVGIMTIPAILGEKRGKLFVAITTVLALFATPLFFLCSWVTFVTAAVFAVPLFVFITHNNYRELPVFLTYFAFFGVFILEFVLLH